MGLEKPLFEFKNSGIMSIPPGFLAVSIDLPLLRERCAEDLWSEVHARRNTGRPTSKATAS
jgi:cation/acetate symporter